MNHHHHHRLLVHQLLVLLFVATTKTIVVDGFLPRTMTTTFGVVHRHMQTQSTRKNAPVIALDMTTTDSTTTTTTTTTATTDSTDAAITTAPSSSSSSSSSQHAAVRAPLKYLGPYPALALRFPNLATPSQKKRNVTGISLDFVLDTAANVNTLNGQVAKELDLPVVGKALPGVGTSGPLAGGDNTYLLGDCQLENGLILSNNNNNNDDNNNDDDDQHDTAINESFLFMTNLTASALPVVNPAAAGLLSNAFLQCFPGGVEFAWGKIHADNGTIAESPSVTFYSEFPSSHLEQTMQRVKITPLPVTLLPSITVNINGIEMPALLDTGSPITVLNQQAAKAVGVELAMTDIDDNSNNNKERNRLNPFAKMAKNAQIAQAASRGDVLTLAGGNGQMIHLYKSKHSVPISVASCSGSDENVTFGDGSFVYVGELPGLAALNGLGVGSPPAVVLGMDVLRQRPRMWYCGQQNEVYF